MANASSWKPQWQHRYCQGCSISESYFLMLYLPENRKPSDTWTAAELTHPIYLSSQFGKALRNQNLCTCALLERTLWSPHGNGKMASMGGAAECSASFTSPTWHFKYNNNYSEGRPMYNHILNNQLTKNNLLFENEQIAESDGALMFYGIGQTPCMIWSIIGLPKCPAFLWAFLIVLWLFNDSRKKKYAVRLERKTERTSHPIYFKC